MRKNVIINIYELDTNNHYRIDFKLINDWIDDFFYKSLIDKYNSIQIIQPESTHTLKFDDLKNRKIDFSADQKINKRFFGLIKNLEISNDLIITSKFMYPYTFGNYVYLFKKDNFNLKIEELRYWIDTCFPKRFESFNNLFTGEVNDKFNFIDNCDFIVSTQYDTNWDIGIIVNSKMTDEIIGVIKFMSTDENVDNFEINKFETID
jgi:hypothetical protein